LGVEAEICNIYTYMHSCVRVVLLFLVMSTALSLRCSNSNAISTAVQRSRSTPSMLAKKPDGYYRRPSAAVEQGGGFYVPGLEGTRLRVSAATVLGIGLVANRLLSPDEPVSSQIVSEALGALGCIIVLVQSAAQQRIDQAREQDALRAAFASRLKEQQDIDANLTPAAATRARWAAATLLRLTPARAMVWVANARDAGEKASEVVIIRSGRFPENTRRTLDGRSPPLLSSLLAEGRASATIDELGGDEDRSPLPSNAASLALCRCGDGVVALASEQPAAFTAQHLRQLEACAQLLAMGQPQA